MKYDPRKARGLRVVGDTMPEPPDPTLPRDDATGPELTRPTETAVGDHLDTVRKDLDDLADNTGIDILALAEQVDELGNSLMEAGVENGEANKVLFDAIYALNNRLTRFVDSRQKTMTDVYRLLNLQDEKIRELRVAVGALEVEQEAEPRQDRLEKDMAYIVNLRKAMGLHPGESLMAAVTEAAKRTSPPEEKRERGWTEPIRGRGDEEPHAEVNDDASEWEPVRLQEPQAMKDAEYLEYLAKTFFAHRTFIRQSLESVASRIRAEVG